MSSTYIIVADASRARAIISDRYFKYLQETESLVHGEGRLREQSLSSDLAGRAFDTEGSVRHAMDSANSHKRHEREVFAHDIAMHIDTARKNNQFTRLVLIAAPAMLGELRHALNNECRKLIVEEIAKNLTQHNLDDIRHHLLEPISA